MAYSPVSYGFARCDRRRGGDARNGGPPVAPPSKQSPSWRSTSTIRCPPVRLGVGSRATSPSAVRRFPWSPTSPTSFACPRTSSTSCFDRAPAASCRTERPRARSSSQSGTKLAGPAAKLIHFFAWKGKVFDRDKGELRNEILPFGIEAVRAKVYRDDELAGRQGDDRPRLLEDVARRRTGSGTRSERWDPASISASSSGSATRCCTSRCSSRRER